MSYDFLVRFLNIVAIDIALSGDNAIVIGMAAASLPRNRRKWALILGGGAAILLRVGLTAAATFLMLVPFLSAAGGLVLVWVVYRLLQIDLGGGERPVREAGNMRQAVSLMLGADFMMSLDNVLAVAGSAHGSVLLLAAGLLLSMPLLMTAGGFIAILIDRARWLLYLGAYAISYTAASMVVEDSAVEKHLHLARLAGTLVAALAGLIILTGLVLAHRWKRKRAQRAAPLAPMG